MQLADAAGKGAKESADHMEGEVKYPKALEEVIMLNEKELWGDNSHEGRAKRAAKLIP